ncbi:MAG: hypothetical protein R2867_05920 [Caldilineaceae bacterium]
MFIADMNCIDPPALTELELAMYLDDESDAAVAAHVAACPACHASAVDLAQRQGVLTNLLYRSNCPTPEELRDYQFGLLNRADGSNLALHLARCPHCTRELFVLQEFMADQTATAVQLPAPLEFLVATLTNVASTFASGLVPAGQRGAEPTVLLYQAGDLQIGLEVSVDRENGQRQLHGLITDLSSADALAGLMVHLWRNGHLIATATVDPLLGDFHFANLPLTSQSADQLDAYELIVSAQQTKLRVPQLPLDGAGQ